MTTAAMGMMTMWTVPMKANSAEDAAIAASGELAYLPAMRAIRTAPRIEMIGAGCAALKHEHLSLYLCANGH